MIDYKENQFNSKTSIYLYKYYNVYNPRECKKIFKVYCMYFKELRKIFLTPRDNN